MIDILLSCALLASGMTSNKIVLSVLSPAVYVSIAYIIASLTLLSITRFYGQHLNKKNIFHDSLKLLVIACTARLFPALFSAYALSYIPVSRLGLIISLEPFVMIFYAYWFFGEKLNFWKFIALLLGFSGLAYALGADNLSALSIPVISWPDLAALTSVFLSRYGWIQAFTLLRQYRYNPLQLNGIMMFISGFLAFIISIFYESVTWLDLSNLSVQISLVFLYSVFIGELLSNTLWSRLCLRYSVNFLSLAGFSTPVFATIFGRIFLGEPITSSWLISAAVIFLGLIIFYFQEKKMESKFNCDIPPLP